MTTTFGAVLSVHARQLSHCSEAVFRWRHIFTTSLSNLAANSSRVNVKSWMLLIILFLIGSFRFPHKATVTCTSRNSAGTKVSWTGHSRQLLVTHSLCHVAGFSMSMSSRSHMTRPQRSRQDVGRSGPRCFANARCILLILLWIVQTLRSKSLEVADLICWGHSRFRVDLEKGHCGWASKNSAITISRGFRRTNFGRRLPYETLTVSLPGTGRELSGAFAHWESNSGKSVCLIQSCLVARWKRSSVVFCFIASRMFCAYFQLDPIASCRILMSPKVSTEYRTFHNFCPYKWVKLSELKRPIFDENSRNENAFFSMFPTSMT